MHTHTLAIGSARAYGRARAHVLSLRFPLHSHDVDNGILDMILTDMQSLLGLVAKYTLFITDLPDINRMHCMDLIFLIIK